LGEKRCRIVIASEAKQSMARQSKCGLLRRFAPLRKRFAFVAGNDDAGLLARQETI
jgi:hypothetical protein